MGLGSESPQPFINPIYMLPGFAAAGDNTVWVKSGSSLAALSGFQFSGGNLVVNNVKVGQVDTGVYGMKINSGSDILYLRGGDSNKIAIDYDQTFGGSNGSRNGYLWSVSSAGVFSLSSGQFGGNVDFNSNSITEMDTISGAKLTVDFNATSGPEITSSSGSVSVISPVGTGLIVPSTASQVNSTFALNPTTANALYGQLGSTNTWTQAQTFSAAPTVPDGSFTIAKVNTLQSNLDLALKRDGSNSASGNLNAGGYKILNVATPSSSGDAVNLGYLTSNYITDPVESIAIQAGTPIAVSAATGDITVSMPQASSGADGFLDSGDWTIFNAKQDALSATAPLSISGGDTIFMTQASVGTSGYLSSADFNRFANASASGGWTDGQLMIGNTSSGKAERTTLTAGTGISVTNGNGSITIAFAPNSIPNSRPSVLLNAASAQASVSDTNQTSLYSYTIPADSLAVGDVLTIHISGGMILEAHSETVTQTFAIGGSTIFTTVFDEDDFNQGTNVVPFRIAVTLTVRTIGVSGTIAYSAESITPFTRAMPVSGEASINTTVSRLLNSLFQYSAITGTNEATVENAFVKLN